MFISSTLQELAPERAAARAAIEDLQLTPVLFELGARPHPPRELYRAYVEQSQVFVGIYWQSYGWKAPHAEISGLEDELLLSEQMPRLLYVKEPAAERHPELERLLEGIRSAGSASYRSFATADDLGQLLRGDLAVLISERFRRDDEQRHRNETQLPAPRTRLVGRAAQLAEIDSLFADGDVRLATLTGPGGIGKTRLAVEVARRRADVNDAEVVFVPLESIADPDLVLPTVGAALGLRDTSLERIKERLARRGTFLVLDNFEHVMPAAVVVSELLAAAPRLIVLVTSRELLRLAGEHEVPVPPLSAEDEAVALFVERASAVQRLFDLGTEDAETIAEICRRLDGVPLAIELAAPRLRLLTPQQLLDRLRDRIILTGTRDAPARQQTLEAAIRWSFELLQPAEQALLLRLSLISGSFRIETAEDIAPRADGDVVEQLASLLDKSMIYRVPGRTARFAMLSMIREFGLDRLGERGELQPATEALAAHYLREAPAIEAGLRSSAQRDWKEYLDHEADTIRVAFDWLVQELRSEDAVTLLRAIWLWQWLVGQTDQTVEMSEQIREQSPPTDPNARGWLATIYGFVLFIRNDLAASTRELALARTLLEESNDVLGLGIVGIMRGLVAGPLSGKEESLAILEEQLAGLDALGDVWGVASTLHAITWVRTVFDDYDGADELFERSVVQAHDVGDDFMIAMAVSNDVYFRTARGDVERARADIAELLDLFRATGIRHSFPDVLEAWALLDASSAEPELAAELAAAASHARTSAGVPLWGPAVARFARLLDRLRVELGTEAFEAAWQRGLGLGLDDLAARLPLEREAEPAKP